MKKINILSTLLPLLAIFQSGFCLAEIAGKKSPQGEQMITVCVENYHFAGYLAPGITAIGRLGENAVTRFDAPHIDQPDPGQSHKLKTPSSDKITFSADKAKVFQFCQNTDEFGNFYQYKCYHSYYQVKDHMRFIWYFDGSLGVKENSCY